jgi:hypothetical protein
MLLQYHDKEMFNHLKTHTIHFGIFATSWMITLFTRAVQFFLVYELWEIFLFERDKFMIFYLAVALLKVNRDKILGLNSIEQLIPFFTKDLKIDDF